MKDRSVVLDADSGFAGSVRRNLLALISLKDLLKGKCGVCEYRYVCGGSRARAWAETGDYLASEPRCAYVPPAWLEKVGKHVIGR